MSAQARGSSTSSTTSRLPFGDEYEISVVLTALPFHHNAFYAMQGAYAVESLAGIWPAGRPARLVAIDLFAPREHARNMHAAWVAFRACSTRFYPTINNT